MAFTVTITLTTAGTDISSALDLRSNVNSYATTFETGVSKSSLLSGYQSTLVPDGTTVIRVSSVGTCSNYVDISVSGIPTYTPTPTVLPTATPTVTPTATPTASETCSLVMFMGTYGIGTIRYRACGDDYYTERGIAPYQTITACAATGTVSTSGGVTVSYYGVTCYG